MASIAEAGIQQKTWSILRPVLQEARRLPMLPTAILVLVVVAAFVPSVLAPQDPLDMTPKCKFSPPFWMEAEDFLKEDCPEAGTTKYLLGADSLGRDILSRAIYGARISLIVGLLGAGFAGSLGSFLGMASGYFGRTVDTIIMRWVDIQMSIPGFLLLMLLAVIMGPGLKTIVISYMVVGWVGYARIIRSEVLSLREQDFVFAARVSSVGGLRMIFRHILPNVFNTIMVLVTLQVGRVILFEAALSFLGIGLQPPLIAWGLMASRGRDDLYIAWWLTVVPGVCIALTVLSVNLLGDWLRDRLDPRLRQV